MIEQPDTTDSENPSQDNPADESNEGETATLPISIVGSQQVKEGDVIRLKVVSVDENGGVLNVAYDQPSPQEGSATDKMAAEFDQPQQTGVT